MVRYRNMFSLAHGTSETKSEAHKNGVKNV